MVVTVQLMQLLLNLLVYIPDIGCDVGGLDDCNVDERVCVILDWVDKSIGKSDGHGRGGRMFE